MPIDETDAAFMHIDWIDSTHFTVIVYKRKEIAPFDFEAVLRYNCHLNGNEWAVDSVEILNE